MAINLAPPLPLRTTALAPGASMAAGLGMVPMSATNPIGEKQKIEVPKTLLGPQAEKDWTVLYYLDGSNDLEPFIMQNMRDLEKVGSSKHVNVIAQMSRAPQKVVHKHSKEKTNIDGDWVGSRRYYITKAPGGAKNLHSAVLGFDVDPPNHGQAKSLSDFLKWGMEKFPAKKYMVVIGDHGKGFVGTGFDLLHKDHLQLPELRGALAEVQKETGKKPDMLVFDACEMASLEVAYELKDQAKTLIASEEVLGAEGLPHIAFLRNLARTPGESGKAQAIKLVDFARQDEIDRQEEDRPDVALQLSAIDLTKMAALGKATAKLGEALKSSKIDSQDLKRIVLDTKHFCEDSKVTPDSHYRDLGHFCNNLLQSDETDAKTKKAAQEVKAALAKAVIAHHNEGEDMEETTGLSAYIPQTGVPEQFDRHKSWGKFDDSYHNTAFDQDTNWSAWLDQKFAKAS